MHKFLLAVGLAAGCLAASVPANATLTTFTGLSTGVSDPDTGEAEQYTVSFTFDDSPSPYPVFHLTTTKPPYVNYDYSYYTNLVAFSVVGPRYDVSYDSGFSQVSTLDSSRAQDGLAGFHVGAGSDSTTVGYALQFNYLPQTAFANTSMPTSLNIADALDAGFNLTEYYLAGDPDDPDSQYIDSRELLNFRFASGGIVPTAAVPEPAAWATMILGLGAVGWMRRRKVRTSVTYA